MLEQLLIFTRGGLILWELGNALRGSPIDALIRSCLLEERSAESSYDYDAPGGAAYTLKWAFHNDLGLVFVAVYQRILHLLYVDDLLAAVRRDFASLYDPKRTSYHDFDETFRQLQREAEARAEDMRRSKQQLGKNAQPLASGKRPNQGTSQRATGAQANGKGKSSGGGGDASSKDDADGDSGKGQWLASGKVNGHESGIKGPRAPSAVKGKENGPPEAGAFDVNKLQKLRAKGGKKADATGGGGKASRAETKKIVKKNRVWDDSPSESKLDFTDPVDERGDGVVEVAAADQGESMMDKEEVVSSDSEVEEDEEVESAKTSEKKKGWFSSMFQR